MHLVNPMPLQWARRLPATLWRVLLSLVLAALLVTIFVGVATALDLPPALFAAAIAVSASCAFMLRVATPPNAIVYGTGLLPQATMMRCGLVLNLVCIVAIVALAQILYG